MVAPALLMAGKFGLKALPLLSAAAGAAPIARIGCSRIWKGTVDALEENIRCSEFPRNFLEICECYTNTEDIIKKCSMLVS